LVAAGLRSSWGVKPYLDLLLPEIEEVVRQRNLSRLIYVGPAAWLIDELEQRGFQVREWIVILQRSGLEAPDKPPDRAQLRPFHPYDIGPVTRLDTLAFDQLWHKSPSKFAQALATSDSLAVAELAGQLVGYAWCEIHPNHAHLNRLAVHPDYQGRGIGAQLLHWAITTALTQGAAKITLNTQEHNLRSIALYQRFGFETTGQRMPVLVKSLV
jgi:ribosomal protein S18 acetylase RimI-like enzyme